MSELWHAVKKGYAKPNHKYVSRTYKNGRWVYQYSKSGKSTGKSVQVSSSIKKGTYSENDSDFDEKNYSEKNRIGGTDFFKFTRPDGSTVILEEDMKWVIPAGVDTKGIENRLTRTSNTIASKRKQGEKVTGEDWNHLVDSAIAANHLPEKKKKAEKSGSSWLSRRL